MGFVGSWKKYGDTDEGKLLTSFLLPGRNERKSVRLFLRLRKILLKNLNQKILQEIKLNHCRNSLSFRRRSDDNSYSGHGFWLTKKDPHPQNQRSLYFQEREAPQQRDVLLCLAELDWMQLCFASTSFRKSTTGLTTRTGLTPTSAKKSPKSSKVRISSSKSFRRKASRIKSSNLMEKMKATMKWRWIQTPQGLSRAAKSRTGRVERVRTKKVRSLWWVWRNAWRSCTS